MIRQSTDWIQKHPKKAKSATSLEFCTYVYVAIARTLKKSLTTTRNADSSLRSYSGFSLTVAFTDSMLETLSLLGLFPKIRDC